MNKKIKLIIVSLILLVIVGINISYAISTTDESSFFEVNKDKLSVGETLEMTIDLSKIDSENFKLVLNSNVEMEDVYTDETSVADSDIKLDKESNDVVINIDKEKLNLSKMVLYYEIPENLEVGTKLQINAQAIISEDDEEKVVDEKQVEITIVEKNQEDSENEDNKNQEDNKDDNKDDNNKNEETKNPEDNKNDSNKNEENKREENINVENKDEGTKSPEENTNKEQQGNQQNETMPESQGQNAMQNMQGTNSNQVAGSTSTMQSMTNISSDTKAAVAQEETATYNGSNNNYLSSLEIDGVELTSDFNKEKSTYFATVENLETITVTANAEDSSSKVAITGTDLKSGVNKVLISVTAENGEVRYYRIYVTNN